MTSVKHGFHIFITSIRHFLEELGGKVSRADLNMIKMHHVHIRKCHNETSMSDEYVLRKHLNYNT